MYIIKNAFKNITRNKGKNILICTIITVITICSCIGLSIYKVGKNLVNNYVKTNPLEISFSIDMQKLRKASDDEKNSFKSLTVENIKEYANSQLVKDYYYTLESSLNSSSIEAVDDNKRPNSDMPEQFNDKDNNKEMDNMGDFRITAYSNFAYLADFSEGNKKIVSGKMITKSSSDNEIVISKSLANKNNLKVGDEIEFNLPNNDDDKLKFKIVGIYSNTSEKNSNNFIEINALNEANQIYINLSSIESILSKQSDTSDKLIDNNGLDVKIYLNKRSDLSKFKKEVKQKGLSSYYKITTNKNQIKESLKHIKNISKFSINFLIVVLVLGVIILSVINILNIRDRKYEIGVLRAIGMSKQKITLQFIYETLIISLFSLVIGTCIGLTIMKPITNKILESEINSYQEKITNNEINFGEGDFRKPSEQIDRGEFKDIKNKNMKQDNNITYVDSLKVRLDFTTILELFGISILLAVCSTAISSIIINKYNPNKILQNRT